MANDVQIDFVIDEGHHHIEAIRQGHGFRRQFRREVVNGDVLRTAGFESRFHVVLAVEHGHFDAVVEHCAHESGDIISFTAKLPAELRQHGGRYSRVLLQKVVEAAFIQGPGLHRGLRHQGGRPSFGLQEAHDACNFARSELRHHRRWPPLGGLIDCDGALFDDVATVTLVALPEDFVAGRKANVLQAITEQHQTQLADLREQVQRVQQFQGWLLHGADV
mmetsp:Transcript_25251/g.55909  ORF Transcript_25251/g.55909 Transcript_25251/m.55909 type:complete len:220 (-) Transcript_25251:28-687(-)